ncbi:MAG: type II secretion system F family protein [Candidatus Omnitrophica bacterium]|nr:type II secretion system F family protein [Candidatus Omnitrophota bacterium]
MPKFVYVVRDKDGRKVSGVEESPNQEELIGRLQAKDFIVISIALEGKEAESGKAENLVTSEFKRKHYGVHSNDLVLFCRQLATLLGAGVTILKSVDIISQQVTSHKLYHVLKSIEKNMEAGLSLHEAMAKYPSVFSDLWINLVESGEASGNIAVVLDRLASYLERNAEFRKKIISALIYPAILLFAGMGALLFLTIKIIPTFAELFAGFNIELPLLTRVLIAVSAFIRKFGIGIIGTIIVLVIVIKRYIATREGRKRNEGLKFRLPIFGEFFRALIVERFSSEMSTLLESGVPILYSLEIAEQSVGNLIMGDIIKQVKEDVRQGKTLSAPLAKSGFFEPMVVQMVNIGEEIGELSPMLKKINAFYQGYVETFLARFVSLFEPIMLIFMGVIIGIMVVGMFLPIFQIANIGSAAGK